MGDDPERATVEAGHEDHGRSMHRLFDLSIDLLAVLDLETTVLEASQSFERTLGWSPADLIGRSFLELFHEDDLPRVETELAALLEGDDAVGVVVRMYTRQGDHRWVQGNARSDLAAGRIYVTGADITDRMELERSLRHHLQLEELVSVIATRLIGVEDDQVLSEIEAGLGELATALGADRGHFMRGQGRTEPPTYVEWRNPETTAGYHVPAPQRDVQEWWGNVLLEGRDLCLADLGELEQEAPHVVEALRLDGAQSLVHVSLPPHRGHWGFLTMVAVREPVSFGDAALTLLRVTGESFMTALAAADDAAALREVRRELERGNEELISTNEDLERFAYAAAHDLKAPLSRVEMALAATPLVEGPSGELLGVARRAATRMRQLIEDLLVFAAAGSAAGPPAPVDLDEVLTQVLSDLQPIIDDRAIDIHRSPLPTVNGHRALLGQLIQNVVGNAVKFTSGYSAPLVQIAAAVKDDGVTITVRDNGIGIARRHRTEVFGVFTRLHPEEVYGGSGIGLATCAKVVQQHDGRIWIEDGIDGGTAVCIWLPRLGAVRASARLESDDGASGSGRRAPTLDARPEHPDR